MEIKEFLKAIGLDVEAEGYYIEVRLIGQGSRWYESVDALALDFDNLKALKTNLYFGVCPRFSKCGRKEFVAVVPSLWADLDGKDYPGGKEEALTRLTAFTPAPTAVNDSGNGYHAFWSLKQPVTISSPQDTLEIEGILKGLAHALNADPACAELARILRLPNSLNYKDKINPKPVTMISLDATRRYDLSEFDKFIMSATPTQTKPKQTVAELVTGLRKGNYHTSFLSLAGKMKYKGLSYEDTLAAICLMAQAEAVSQKDAEKIVQYVYSKEEFGHFLGEARRLPHSGSLPSTSFTSSLSVREEGKERQCRDLISFHDLLTTAPKTIDWRVNPVFPKQGVGIIAGAGGLGKSWLSGALSVAVATQSKWLGQYVTQTCPVLYVDLENSPSLLSRRFNKLIAAEGLTPADVTNFYFYKPEALQIDTLEGFNAISQAMEQTGAKFVVLDSLTRIHAGDENTVKDMARVSKALLALTIRFDACIILIDHLGKVSNGLRGSTEKRAMPETILEVEQFDEKKNIMKVKVTKLRATGEKPDPFLVQILDLSPEQTVVKVVTEDDSADFTRDLDLEWLLQFLEDRGSRISRPDLIKEVKTTKNWGEKKVTAILYRAISLKKIKITAEANPETKRLQHVIELVRDLVPGEQLSLPEKEWDLNFLDEAVAI